MSVNKMNCSCLIRSNNCWCECYLPRHKFPAPESVQTQASPRPQERKFMFQPTSPQSVSLKSGDCRRPNSRAKQALSIDRTGSTHIHCCKGMKYKAISKYYLLLISFIHNKLENDQKYVCRAFYNSNSKKESSSSKPLRFPPLDIG